MAQPQSALRTSAVDHIHSAGEICPYCEQEIPNDRAEEIRARFESKQRQAEAAMNARVADQVATARAELETSKQSEIQKVREEGSAAIEKMKADVLNLQNAARQEGKDAANAEAQQKIDAMVAAQEESRLKFEDLERQRIAAVGQLEALKANQEALVAQRTGEVRASLEKDKVAEIDALKAQHNEETQKLADQMQAMRRQLDTEEGEGANLNLIDALKEKFPKDDITRVNKTNGADIIHVVKHNKKECGKIVYDSRNRNLWQATFATNLRNDMVTAKAQHAILTTSKFPTGIRQVHLCEGVIVANPARVLALAELLRDEIVQNHSRRMSEEDRDRKTAKLYDFIASDQFDDLLGSLDGNDEKLLQLDEEEQKAHKALWEKRRRLTTSSQRLHANLRIEIDRIIGTADAE